MTTLLIAEHDHGSLKDVTAKALAAAKAMGEPIHVLVAGSNARGVAEAAARLDGVDKVLLADDARYDHMLAEPTAALIASLAQPYAAIVAAATTTGKNVMPRVAALLDVMQVSDIVKVVGPDTFERPIYAGNAIQTVQATDAKRVTTVRTAAFQPAAEGGQAAPIETAPAAAAAPDGSTFKGEEIAQNDRPELTSARIVISGGRGMQNGENFKLLERVADRLSA
ncbi:MAG: electron transfer flavoprotein subunit alpha/FixB family protein, partial [Microvirga sp.]